MTLYTVIANLQQLIQDQAALQETRKHSPYWGEGQVTEDGYHLGGYLGLRSLLGWTTHSPLKYWQPAWPQVYAWFLDLYGPGEGLRGYANTASEALDHLTQVLAVLSPSPGQLRLECNWGLTDTGWDYTTLLEAAWR